MPTIINTGFRNLGTGFAAAQAMSSLPYVNRSKAVGKARGQLSRAEGQINDAVGKLQQVKTGVNQVASTVGDVLGLFGIGKQPVGNTDNKFFNYKVHILSNGKHIAPVHGYLQGDSLDMSIKSQWEGAFSTLNALASVANAPAQYIAGTTLRPRALTRRIWLGNNPLTLTIPLKFQTTNVASENVLKPCVALQLMASPRIGKLGSLVPPGPSPMYGITMEAMIKKIKGVTGADVGKAAQSIKQGIRKYTTVGKAALEVVDKLKTDYVEDGDNIRINIGNFLRFDHVVITDLDIKYATKFDAAGLPVSAEASITFETFEVLTQQAIRNTYQFYNPL